MPEPREVPDDASEDDHLVCAVVDCGREPYARAWCERHYRRWRRTGSTEGRATSGTCTVPACDRTATARQLCHGHYQRWRRTGEVQPELPLSEPRSTTCLVEGCERVPHAKGLCRSHRARQVEQGALAPEVPIGELPRPSGPTGRARGWTTNGYRYVPVPPDQRHLTNAAYAAEHRLVMARHLGRALSDEETVHHLNGDRQDNRLENLELWSSAQPSGQRVADKITFAHQLLRRYAPHLLADSTGMAASADTPTSD